MIPLRLFLPPGLCHFLQFCTVPLQNSSLEVPAGFLPEQASSVTAVLLLLLLPQKNFSPGSTRRAQFFPRVTAGPR